MAARAAAAGRRSHGRGRKSGESGPPRQAHSENACEIEREVFGDQDQVVPAALAPTGARTPMHLKSFSRAGLSRAAARVFLPCFDPILNS